MPTSPSVRSSYAPLSSTSTPSSANAWMCVSSRRRPITSPPGGGTIARPNRASSGPASRNEARISRQRSGSSSVFETPARVDRHLVRPRPVGVGAEVGEQLDHRLDVADARDVRQRDGLGGEDGRGEDRQGAVLVPGRADGARERTTAFDDERLHAGRYRTRLRGGDPRRRLGDADALHEERVAASSRARGRGVDALLRADARRGRGAVGLRRAAPRLRLRDAPDARQAPAGRRADPARGGLPGGR